MSLEQAFQQIKNKCKELKRKLGAKSAIYIPLNEREQLAQLWERYISLLPPEHRERAIAIVGYPKVVPLEQVPNQIRADPHFASIIVNVYGK